MPAHLSPIRAFATLLLLAAGLAPRPVAAQDLVIRAFGDSITEGYGDTTILNGYPERLERRLRQAGRDVDVTQHGVGGETTLEGLSRIDNVVALGGDYVLLMEGTNDISKRIGVEAIVRNLDEMATYAEEAGFVAVHATLIPRIPTAPSDGDNARNAALAAAILELGELRFRAVADVFHHFEDLPDLFETYYYYDEEVPDIVGHPNNFGYIEIATVFFETMGPLLDGPQLQVVPPAAPNAPGELLEFRVQSQGAIGRVDWSFGDGGFASSVTAPDFEADYFYAEPGTYTVTATAFALTGQRISDSASVVVTGTPAPLESRTLVIAAVAGAPADSTRPVDGDLNLGNASGSPSLADVTFLPEIRFDTPAETLRILVPPGGVTFDDALASLFGIELGRGALRIDFQTFGSPLTASAGVLLRAPDDLDGSSGCNVAGAGAQGWSSAPKQIAGISYVAGEQVLFHVANPGATAGSVRLDLYDAVNSFVGSGLFELAPGAARERRLDDLFRSLAARPKPFQAQFSSSGIEFATHAVVSGNGDVIRCLASNP